MGKQARESRLNESEAMAVGRNIRVSPRSTWRSLIVLAVGPDMR